MAIWIAQFVGREIKLLDYIEGIGQPLAHYADELRRRGWKDAIIYLPHDGVATNKITGKRYIDHWTEAGFECGTPMVLTLRRCIRLYGNRLRGAAGEVVGEQQAIVTAAHG
jgi:hypothetical protein